MPGILADKPQTQDDLIAAVFGEERLLAALAEEIREDINELWVTDRV